MTFHTYPMFSMLPKSHPVVCRKKGTHKSACAELIKTKHCNKMYIVMSLSQILTVQKKTEKSAIINKHVHVLKIMLLPLQLLWAWHQKWVTMNCLSICTFHCLQICEGGNFLLLVFVILHFWVERTSGWTETEAKRQRQESNGKKNSKYLK